MTRRARFAVGLAGVGLALIWAERAAALRLYPTALATGWTLALLTLALLLLAGRKLVPFLPVGRTSLWLAGHVATGVLALLVFALHTGLRLPRGVLESSLAAIFVTVSASGVVGLWLSRSLARRLATRGQEVLYERLPQLRRRVLERADELVLESVQATGSPALADFYRARLRPFLEGPGRRLPHLVGSARPLQLLLEELRAFERYLDADGRQLAKGLEELLTIKDDLDYHFALQGLLRAWLWVHVPLSLALLPLLAVHATLAQVFAGALR